MPGDDTRAVRPITDFVDLADIPLAEFMPIGAHAALENILVANAWTGLDESGFTLSAEFNLCGLSDLQLPGLNQFSLSFNGDGFSRGVMKCGPEPSLELTDIELELKIDPIILRTRDGGAAVISASCGIRFDCEGFHFVTFGGASLAEALVAGTDISISLEHITLGSSRDQFLKIAAGKLTLPMLKDASDKPLELIGRDMSFGRDGPTGIFSKGVGAVLDLTLGDFACKIAAAEITLCEGQLTGFDISGRINLEKFLAAGREDGWVAVDFSIGPDGMIAALSGDDPIVSMVIDGMFHLAIDGIRLESAGLSTIWLSGALTPDIDGTDGGWPTLEFDEIGVTAGGELCLAQGASIATTQPFTLSWNFLKLTISSFSLERPDDAPNELELHLSAAVEIIEGVPAGASVEGLVVHLRADKSVAVRFDGIGIHFATPGAYSVSALISWDETRMALSGSGHLDVEALDLRLGVVFASAVETVDDANLTTIFVAAESSLIPGGVPIGTTGLSLYGVSGLLTHNLALKLPHEGPRRYFDAFSTAPQGFASPTKWRPSKGAHTLGLGVVIGTADDGWLFSARGGLMLSIEDLTLLITASADLLQKRQPMSSTDPAKFAAVLAVHPASGLFRLDFKADWQNRDLFDLSAEGGGEFQDGKPLGFSVWIGQPPEKGRPVRASAIRVGGSWLLTSDYWFGFNASRGVKLGLRSQIGLRAGASGVYAELVASADARAGLFWNPGQLEGQIALNGRARLVGGGLSLCLSLTACVTVAIAKPMRVEIPLEACIEVNYGFDTLRLCLHYTFAWRDEVTPTLDHLLQGLTLVPRHWTPRKGPAGEMDDGIVGHVSVDGSGTIDLGVVHPHSELVLEASKSLLVELPAAAPVKLNDMAIPLPERIGDQSDWLTQWVLTGLSLKDQTAGGQEVDLFGTFSRSPLAREENGRRVSPRPPNTELRLLSSRRFGQDGSLGGGGAEETPSIDCSPKETKRETCVKLAGLPTGSGRLSNGWIYHWKTLPFLDDRDNRHGVALGGEDYFRFYPPEGIKWVDLILAARTPNGPAPGTERVQRCAVQSPAPIEFTQRDLILLMVCWAQQIAADGTNNTSGWSGSSGEEEWTVDATKRLLIPGHDYALDVTIEGRTLRGTMQVGPPLKTTRNYRFKAGPAPDWRDGLVRAIRGIYPADGVRPAFRDYDLLIHFQDDYLESLYRLEGRALGVRLRDSNGNAVHGPKGAVLLPTNWQDGPTSRSPSEAWWGSARAADPGSKCDPGTPPPANGQTVLPIALKDLNLRALTRYSAELVAVKLVDTADTTDALASWSFTTSRFADFSDLAAMPTRAAPSGLIALAPAATDGFDDLMRSFGAPSVAVVETMRMTPVRYGESVSHLLIEAPEPIDDEYGRLSIQLGKGPTRVIANLDATRVVAVLPEPVPITSPTDVLDVELRWRSAPATAPEATRSVRGVATDAVLRWKVSMSGVSS